MLSSLFALLGSEGLFWMLRVSPVTGSFPQPLSAAREREALLAMAAKKTSSLLRTDTI